MLRAIFAVVCAWGVALSASGEVVLYDSQGFEDPPFDAGESPVGRDGWLDFGGSPASYVVQDSVVASGEQAVQANGGGLNDGAFVWPDLGYTPGANERVRIQVDIARTLTAADVPNSSPVYAIDVYDFSFDRTSRFGLQQNGGVIRTFVSVPINGMGQIDPAGPSIRSEYYGPAIAENQFVHFDFLMDYATKTVSMTVDGNRLASLVPFRTQASTTLDSAELQIGTFNNISADFGYFDNYVVSTVLKGDYNYDGVVDALDYTVWRNALEPVDPEAPIVLAADGDGDGMIGAGDFDVWKARYGNAELLELGAGGVAVPEPASVALIVLWLSAFVVARRRR